MANQTGHPPPNTSSPRSPSPSGSTSRKRPAKHSEPQTLADPGKTNRSVKRPKTDSYKASRQITQPLSLKRDATTQDSDDDEILPEESSRAEKVAVRKSNKRLRSKLNTAAEGDEDATTLQAGSQVENGTVGDGNADEPAQSSVLGNPDQSEPQDGVEESGINDEEEEGDIPLQPPPEAFTVTPPPKDLSWTKTPYPPTLPYTNQDNCPIDWNYIDAHSTGLDDANKMAYEFRKPWLSKADGGEIGYEKMVTMFHNANDTSVNQLESARKRFKKANNIVFLATGVFFEGSTAGLPDDYKPRITKDRKQQQQQYQQQHGAAAKSTKSKAPKAPNATQASSGHRDPEDDHDDQDDSGKGRNPGNGPDDSDAELTPGPPYMVEKDALPKDNRSGYKLLTFFLKPSEDENQDRCLLCCKEGKCYNKDCLDDPHVNETGPNAESSEEDHGYYNHGPPPKKHSRNDWLQALEAVSAPFHECPEHGFVRREVHAIKFLAVSHSKIPETKTYVMDMSTKAFDVMTSCFAPRLREEVPEVLDRLDVFLDHEDYNARKEYTKAYYQEDESGYTVADLVEAYCGSQALQMPMVSDIILNSLKKIFETDTTEIVEPKAIKYAWSHTHAGDPLRLFFLDVFRLKPDVVEDQIQNQGAKYPSELLRYWSRWKLTQQSEIPDQLSAEEEQAMITLASFTTFTGRLGPKKGVLGRLEKVKGGVVFKRWTKKTWEPSKFSRDQVHRQFIQTVSMDELSAGRDNTFCRNYHNHGSHDPPVYRCIKSQIQSANGGRKKVKLNAHQKASVA